MSSRLWTVVLAAGQGRRLAGVTGGIPKQFWRPDGERSLLEETLDRVAPLASPDHTLTIVGQTQRPFLEQLGCGARLGRAVYQPGDRGTAAGVILGLSAVAADDPGAIVLLSPSDHGVARPDLFVERIDAATREVTSGHADVILCGFLPTSLASDYGWIVPGAQHVRHPSLKSVRSFVEKPAPDVARTLFLDGAVWNTMVLVARAQSLLNLYRQHLPPLYDAFAECRLVPRRLQDEFLKDIYPGLPSRDFSRDVLSPAKGLALQVWPSSLGWTDLGTPDRLTAWLTGQAGGTDRLDAPRAPVSIVA